MKSASSALSRPRFWSWLNWAKQSEAEHPHRRPLMLAQEVARMAPDEQVILRAGVLPMKTRRARWFDDANFTGLVEEPPDIPRLEVRVAEDDGRAFGVVGAGRGGASGALSSLPVPEDAEAT